MPRRGSPLATFLLDALMSNTYPSRLFWVDNSNSIFCLRCVCRHSRAWTRADLKIFEDYHNLRTRRTEDDMRQRFLIALRKSPFIQELKDISLKEEKYYVLKVGDQPGIEVLEDAIEMDSFEDASPLGTSGEESGIEPMAVPENDAPNAAAVFIDDFIARAANEDDASGFELLGGCEFDPDAFEINDGHAEDDLVPGAVMDISEPLSIGDSQSLFSDSVVQNSAVENVFSCNHTPDLSDVWQLEEEENNCNLEESIDPPNYDPEENLGPLQEIPNTVAGSSQCEVRGLYSVDENAEVAKLLQKDGDSPEPLFMLVLKPKNE